MNYKNKKLIFNILLIITIHIILLINNSQRTSFRYFTWKIQDVSIGRLIFISFFSGLLISSLLNKTSNFNTRNNPTIEIDNKLIDENDYSVNIKDNIELNEVTPERDLRDPQPTISVNYRVIKNSVDNDYKDRNQIINDSPYDDDWNKDGVEW